MLGKRGVINIMHHLAFHSFKSESHKFSFPQRVDPFLKVARHKVYQSTRIHGTRANIKKMADFLEQENRLLKEEMATMQAKMNEMAATQTQVDELTELVRTLRASQNQPPSPIPNKLSARWKPDLRCAFHQGAQGHDIEHCFSLKIEVQKLIDADALPFKNLNSSM